MALEQDAGITPCVQGPVGLAAGDDPDPLERLIAAFGQGDAVGLLPLRAWIVVRVEDLRPVEGRGHGREQPSAPGIAGREVDRLPRKRARFDLKAGTWLAFEQEQALLRPHH
jgi:hypothetical protein